MSLENERLQTAAAQNRDEVLVTAQRITIGSTSATLGSRLATALASDLTSVMIVPESAGDDIRMNIGSAASAATARVPAAGVLIPTTKTLADTIHLYSSGTVYATILSFGPRN